MTCKNRLRLCSHLKSWITPFRIGVDSVIRIAMGMPCHHDFEFVVICRTECRYTLYKYFK